MSIAKINARLATFTTNADKQNAFHHVTCMMIMKHAEQHGDCTTAIAAVKAMPASMRRSMLIQWFAKHSPIVVKLAGAKGEDACGFNATYMKLKGAEAKVSHWDIDAADAEPFYMLADAIPEETPFDLAKAIKMLQSLSGRLAKEIKDGNIPANDLDKVTELSAKVSAIAA